MSLEPQFLQIEEASRASEARSVARSMARMLGFDETGAERAAIIASEACTNLLKHAGGGMLALSSNRAENIELLAMDRGPGMANIAECLSDGFSTAGTSGTGLGAIGRLSAFSDAYSQPGRGTVLFALIAKQRSAKLAAPPVCGLGIPKPGQMVCGDSWGWKSGRNRTTLVVADGLGHGPDAAAASRRAIEIFDRSPESMPAEILEVIHLGLRSTRGAAVSVASMDPERRIVDFAGLGNVSGYVCPRGANPQQMVTMNGTAGLEGRTVYREFRYPWPEGAVVVMHSDGLTSHWNLTDSPALLTHGPALIAGVLFRDFRRSTDDATVVTFV